MQFKTIFYLAFTFLMFPGSALAEQDPQACFEQKDKACLEAIFKDIVDEPTQEKKDAIYFLGLLHLEDESFEEAKRTFEMGTMFGDNPRSTDKFMELIKSGNVEVEPTDCLAIGTESCFLNVAENNPQEADSAYYLLARMLAESDPKRAAEFTLKAAELGHTTASCLLSFGYAHEKATGASVTARFVPQLEKNFEKSRQWSEKCGNGPFAGFSEKYFNKYLGATNHKAYAKFGSRYQVYTEGAATPEIAAVVAGALCQGGTKKLEQNHECLIVNVDGQWVDYVAAPTPPERVGGIDDLILTSAREFYNNKYKQAGKPKVFVQGPLGNWFSRYGNSNESIEETTKFAITKCQEGWRYKKYGSACRVVIQNDEWVK